ncbi:hypothetical protein DFH29DRAFT_1009923 [Suillus ampliporus]|nr:hypothetical protein DFH29DRAFT_1009923 [Suillus ampliporus]
MVTVRGNREDENGELLEEEVELWSRDPVECVKELIGNPSFKADMAYNPSQSFSDPAGEHRVIDEMWTADWWAEKEQKALPDGATIAPIILASDKNLVVPIPRGTRHHGRYICLSATLPKPKGVRRSGERQMLMGTYPQANSTALLRTRAP